MRDGAYKLKYGVKFAHGKHPVLQCLVRGCDALILQKEDKINKSMFFFGQSVKF